MKKIVLLALGSCLSLQIFAQKSVFDPSQNDIKLGQVIKMKQNGRTATLIGGGLITLGLIVGLNASNSTTSTYQNNSGSSLQLADASLVFGVACAGIGIPFWTVGAHREKKFTQNRTTLSLAPHANGMTLHLRF